MKSLNIMQFSNSKNNINTKSKTTKIKSTSYYPSKKHSYNKFRQKWNMVSLYRDPNLPRGGCGSCRGAM